MIEEEEFRLWPTISVSDKDFKIKVGNEMWEKIKSKTFRGDGYCCQGCTFEPFDVPPETVLDIHLVEENLENPEDSEFRTTCEFCHYVEHVDSALSQGFVELVNSHSSQGQLVNICRNNDLSSHIENGEIRYIKKSPKEFLEDINNGIAREGRVKVVFTEKFLRKVGIVN